ncbi:hypothetical protein BDL97_10G038000 [Sphagnum fallax]|nr:hypothetical protein BDL97_10G038000 [Sphagnum fallax]
MEHELQMLLKTPGNECCADCKAIFPRYASITLAIFLCNRCYNIHRCMGAHITHTKSVGFDKWSYEEVGHMSSIGNAIANLYWEENVPHGYKRPTMDSPNWEIEKWIHDKYERKLFCFGELPPPLGTTNVRDYITRHASKKLINSHQVKLTPLGSLRCGPNCVAKVVAIDMAAASWSDESLGFHDRNNNDNNNLSSNSSYNSVAETWSNPKSQQLDTMNLTNSSYGTPESNLSSNSSVPPAISSSSSLNQAYPLIVWNANSFAADGDDDINVNSDNGDDDEFGSYVQA